MNARKQFLPYLKRTERWASIVAHRRAGKTVACIQDLIARASKADQREPRFAYIGPTYGQTKDVAWQYLKEYTAGIPGITTSESELSVTFAHNKARIRLYGAENYDRLRGLYLDSCVIDEVADIDPRAFPEVIRPALSDRRGSCSFIGTPKGRNAFYRIHSQAEKDPDWFTATLKASKTGIIDAKELEDARKQMTPEQFEAEYECSFDAAVIGAYYSKDVQDAEESGRVTNVPHDRAANVIAGLDLGIGDSTSIWLAQQVGQEIHMIDWYENSGEALDHYADWLKSKPYHIDEVLLPHDGDARELQTGKSRKEFLEQRGFDVTVVPIHRVDDGISAVRMAFPKMWFDKTNCEIPLDKLRLYRAKFKTKENVLDRKPLHDENSHTADALRILIMGLEDQNAVSVEFEIEDDWVV